MRNIDIALPQIEECSKIELESYLDNLRKNYDFKKIISNLNNFSDLKVLVIGDIILDEYVFVVPKGRAVKDPILSSDFLYSELYAGGILAVANHLSYYLKNLDLVSIVGDKNDHLDFIKSKLSKNVSFKYFTKKNSYTTIKKRYVNKERNEKLFKIEFLTDDPIEQKLEKEIIDYLVINLRNYDLVIVADFGHGFINSNIIRIIENYSKYLCLNVQSNSANLGFNYITKYSKADFISMDLRELQYAMHSRFSSYDILISKLKQQMDFKSILITLGKHGSVFYSDSKEYMVPVFRTKVADTVGAGDAVFSVTSLLNYSNVDSELIPFFANCVGGVAVGIIGNKDFVTKESLLKFIKMMYKNELE